MVRYSEHRLADRTSPHGSHASCHGQHPRRRSAISLRAPDSTAVPERPFDLRRYADHKAPKAFSGLPCAERFLGSVATGVCPEMILASPAEPTGASAYVQPPARTSRTVRVCPLWTHRHSHGGCVGSPPAALPSGRPYSSGTLLTSRCPSGENVGLVVGAGGPGVGAVTQSCGASTYSAKRSVPTARNRLLMSSARSVKPLRRNQSSRARWPGRGVDRGAGPAWASRAARRTPQAWPAEPSSRSARRASCCRAHRSHRSSGPSRTASPAPWDEGSLIAPVRGGRRGTPVGGT